MNTTDIARLRHQIAATTDQAAIYRHLADYTTHHSNGNLDVWAEEADRFNRLVAEMVAEIESLNSELAERLALS